MAIVVTGGVLVNGVNSYAQVVVDSDTADITAQVGNINPGPTSTGTIIKPTPEPIPPALEPMVTINAPAGTEQKNQTINGQQEVVWIFKYDRPYFYGITNIPSALITLTITGAERLSATSNATLDGKWDWKAPLPLKAGEYNIVATASYPLDSSVNATASLYFNIQLDNDETAPSDTATPSKPTTPSKPGTMEPPVAPESGTSFALQLVIPKEFKEIRAGDSFLAKLSVTPTPPLDGKSEDLPVLFVIQNQAGDVVTENKEMLIITGDMVFNKTFYTSQKLATGTYTLYAISKNADQTVIASDSFEIKIEPAAAPLQIYKPINIALVTSSIGLMLLFMIIAFFEYRRVSALTKIIRQLSPNSQP